MAIYTVTFDLIGSYSGDIPKLSAIYGGTKIGMAYAYDTSSSLSFNIDTSQPFNHTHLRFYFVKASGTSGDEISVSNVRINSAALEMDSFSEDKGGDVASDILYLGKGDYSDFDAADILIDTSLSSSRPGVTMSGTNLDNKILGSDTDNVIDGRGGDDKIKASAGDDVIYGSTGSDKLSGGEGHDEIYAGDQTRIDINSGNLLSYAGSQDSSAPVNYLDDGVGIELTGNSWKKMIVDYNVTSNTVLEFDFKSTLQSEISAIGFDTDNNISNNLSFQVYGDQSWGRMNYYNYDGSGDWIHYEINVGNFFTGAYQYLTLINDDDGGGTDGNGWFRNIVIHEGSEGTNYLSGDGGLDDIYGDSGTDTFIFKSESAFVETDRIHNFNTQDGDRLDISNLLSNWDGSRDINDYVLFTDSGDHSIMSVDSDGIANGANFKAAAAILGGEGLNADDLYLNGNLVLLNS